VHTTDTRVPDGEPIAVIVQIEIGAAELADDHGEVTRRRSRCIARATAEPFRGDFRASDRLAPRNPAPTVA
jgi:hypothetical protein